MRNLHFFKLLVYLRMNVQIVIIFFVTTKIEHTVTNECDQTYSGHKGNTATIVYTPYSRFESRTWIHSFGQFRQYLSPTVVYNINSKASRPTRYIEEFFDGRYMLKIHNVTINDSGLYIVLCFTAGLGIFYSDITDLQITREHETTEVENQTLVQPIDETTQRKDAHKFGNNSAYEKYSAKDKTMIIGIVIGIAVGIVATLSVVLVILLICKHRKSPNSANILKTSTENHTMEARTVDSTRNESSGANSGYVGLHPTSRSKHEREYRDLVTSQPRRDYENQERESARYLNI